MGNNARGRLVYTVVRLPDDLRQALGFGAKERRRIVGAIEGVPVRLALNPDPGRGHYLMVSKSTLRCIARAIGDPVQVTFDLVGEDDLLVPHELRRALDDDPRARAVWVSMTVGKQRIWATYVDGAKRADTRARRSQEVVSRLLSGQLDPRKRWVS